MRAEEEVGPEAMVCSFECLDTVLETLLSTSTEYVVFGLGETEDSLLSFESGLALELLAEGGLLDFLALSMFLSPKLNGKSQFGAETM